MITHLLPGATPAQRRGFAIVIALGLVLRVAWGWAVPVGPISDSHAYDTFARNLVQYGVFGWTADRPFAFWPPGTSMLYAAVYALFGFHHGALVVLHVLLSAVMLVSGARVAARTLGLQAALVATGVLALWPTLVVFTTILASELPYLALTVLALDVWTSPRPHWAVRAAVAGALLGAAALVRPQALLLPLIYGAGQWLAEGRAPGEWRRHAAMAALATMALAAVVAPWTLRNLRLYGEPVLIATNGPITFWMGNTPDSNGGYQDIPQELSALSDLEVAKVLGARARTQVLADVPGFALRTAKKVVLLFANESIGIVWNAQGVAAAWGEPAVTPLKRFTQAAWALIFLLGVAGLWQAVRNRRGTGGRAMPLAAPLLVIGYYTAVHSVIVAQDRYHLVFAVQWALLAGLGVMALARWMNPTRAMQASTARQSTA